MAISYQSTSTPRFYVNLIEWAFSIGAIRNTHLDINAGDNTNHTSEFQDYSRMLPVNKNKGELQQGAFWSESFLMNPFTKPVDVSGNPINTGFIAILGHQLAAVSDTVFALLNTWENDENHAISLDNVINLGGGSGFYQVEYNGFTIATFNGDNFDSMEGMRVLIKPASGEMIGSIVIGSYYEMPHSANLKLTVSHDMGGVKYQRTKGGTELFDHKYTKSPLWIGGLAPWEFDNLPTQGSGDQNLARSGRRSWDLSWTHLKQSDVFGSNQQIGYFSTNSNSWQPVSTFEGLDQSDIKDEGGTNTGYQFNLLTDYNFYSQVLHKSNFGQIPFIFQPNMNDNSNFAIVKLDMKSFKATQIANGIYSMKLKIKEVW